MDERAGTTSIIAFKVSRTVIFNTKMSSHIWRISSFMCTIAKGSRTFKYMKSTIRYTTVPLQFIRGDFIVKWPSISPSVI